MRMSDVSIEERWVTVDRANIRYLEVGSGPPVIMIHGAQTYLSADIFTDVMGPVADGGFRVIAYDQPGYGLSGHPPDYTLSYRITFVTKLMDVLGIESAALVGHAQAGGMVVRLALRAPDRVTAVVSVCNFTSAPPLPGSQPSEAPQEPSASGPTLSDIRAEMGGRRLPQGSDNAGVGREEASAERREERDGSHQASAGPRTPRRRCTGLGAFSGRSALPSFSCTERRTVSRWVSEPG